MPEDPTNFLDEILPDQLESFVTLVDPYSPNWDKHLEAERHLKLFYEKRPWLKPKNKPLWFEKVED